MNKKPVHTDKSEELMVFLLPFLHSSATADAFGRAREALARACLEWHQEIARFASARIEGDLEHARSLSHCGNIADLMNLQQTWAATAARDYTDETAQLIQIATRAIRQGFSEQAPLRQSSD